jgi:serine/threonine protein kinase
VTLSSGTFLGPYQILAPLGAGGMGEVYRARDTRLDRSVAIKVLPHHLAANPELRQRFEREARAVSSLNHPHICTLYDIGHQDGLDYLVMELIEGESLADRLAQGPLPADQVLRYAIQIADALDKAHRAGIVHRDLKPGNIMITRTGAKLLDFGLAKVQAGGSGLESGVTSLPTEGVSLTGAGMIVGTFQYMAPEQLEGSEADSRTDIFAFGAVVYEMATGRKAFTGKSQASLIGAIMHAEPAPISTTQPMTPPTLDRIVKRCLAKDPEDRWQSARDLTIELGCVPEYGSQTGMLPPATVPRKGRERLAWIAAAVLLVGLLVSLPFTISHLRQKPPAEAVAARFTIAPPEKATFGQITVSPDGHSLAFNANVEGQIQLWLRPLDSLTARPLTGTEGTNSFPFWSPDSRSIGFRLGEKLNKMDLTSGTLQTVCNIPGGSTGWGGTWNRDGTILFNGGRIIYRVQAAGGEPLPVPGLDQPRPGVEYRWPSFLPDGRHFLYLVTTAGQEASEVYLASLDGKETKLLLAADSSAIYAASAAGGGYLLFARGEALLAQPFDASSLTLTGEQFRVADQVRVINSRGVFSVSDNGTLIYDPHGNTDNQQLAWFDRAGKQLGLVGTAGNFSIPRLSPDGKRVAVASRDPKTRTRDINVIDLARGASSKLTLDPAEDLWPIWSPDGSRIVWTSNRGRIYQLYQKPASGVGQDELLRESDVDLWSTDWSTDGKFILYFRKDPKTKYDLCVLPLDGDHKPFPPFLQTPFNEIYGRFSPDGRLIAYISDESGNREVYVQTFPASSSKWQVSTKGGSWPEWRGDGKEMFYISGDGKLMAVEVKTGGTFEAGIPKALFDLSAARITPSTVFAVTADGQRFIFVTRTEDTAPSSLAVVVNWTAELKK